MKSFFDSEKGSDGTSEAIDIYADVAPSGAGAVPVYNFKVSTIVTLMINKFFFPYLVKSII